MSTPTCRTGIFLFNSRIQFKKFIAQLKNSVNLQNKTNHNNIIIIITVLVTKRLQNKPIDKSAALQFWEVVVKSNYLTLMPPEGEYSL